MSGEHEIVFEDLHGVEDDTPITVDLDADLKDTGISRTPSGKEADKGAGDDDDIEIVDTRSADKAEKGGDDDDDASKGGEDEKWSKKVKQRIQRATRATKKESERADYWEAQARKLAKENYESRKKAAETTIAQSDSAIESVKSSLTQAIEDGQTEDQVRLQDRLTDLKADKIRAEADLENLPSDGNVQPFDDRVSSDTGKSKADQWKEDQQDWYGASGFERQTRLANRVDREVYKDGYNPDSDDYFEELNRRLKEKEPSLFDEVDDADDDADHGKGDKGRGRRQSPVAGVDTTETGRRRTSSSKVELTEEDFANMRRFNLDVNNPEVLKEYARNKREAEAGEA